MKKMIEISMLAIIGLSFAGVILPGGPAQAALKEPSVQILQGKRCEKCKRGPDGKMVCEPVPCP